MVAAVRVHKAGGPEVLTLEDVDIPAPGPGQLRVKQGAIGINYIDTYFRAGAYPPPNGYPFILGNEGSGDVVAVGPGVTDVKVGDRVAAVFAHGGYAAERLVPVDRAVKVPDNISHEQAAGMMLKGMTAEYLLRRTFKVEKGQTILVHAAAGGVGLILCQWAKKLGATVIGTVGSDDKVDYRPVQVGQVDQGMRVVSGQVSPQDRVIVEGLLRALHPELGRRAAGSLRGVPL
jgi:NADPH2:quinone reductase